MRITIVHEYPGVPGIMTVERTASGPRDYLEPWDDPEAFYALVRRELEEAEHLIGPRFPTDPAGTICRVYGRVLRYPWAAQEYNPCRSWVNDGRVDLVLDLPE